MQPLRVSDLYPLEVYAQMREEFKNRVIAHKKTRRLPLGEHMTLLFEDRLTVQYQIQEMLRIERIFEPDAVRAELDAYNPLIPDGQNWKATLLIEYESPDERVEALRRLVGIEDCFWMRVGSGMRLSGIADEDLDRSTPEKTAAVHFLRFELGDRDWRQALSGAPLAIGIEDRRYAVTVDPLPDEIAESLRADLDPAR
ncbi:MAG: DUF3501 family protein [Gammaproteobacteria bacterium]